MKILIADDDITSRTILEALTTEWGYTPLIATNGKEAWDLIHDSDVRLILLDWEMPHINGPELCKMLMKNQMTIQPYIIMLTAHNNIDEVVQGLQFGANDYITKPYNNLELQARINVGSRMLTLQQELFAAKETLAQLASHDELTGIHNRRSFNERLTYEWNRAARDGTSLSVAILDVDKFKNFNDIYGHLNGDLCLSSVAGTLEDRLKRPGDFIGRYGGEEFGIILPHTSDINAILEDCRASIEELAIPHRESNASVVTVSIGGAMAIPQKTRYSKEHLLTMADKQLYKAKDSGRNRIETIDISEE